MAKNYEAVREALQAAGEEKLQGLSEIFQGHKHWLQQASDELRIQVSNATGKQPSKTTRGRTALKVRETLAWVALSHISQRFQHEEVSKVFVRAHLVSYKAAKKSIQGRKGRFLIN
jgi:hypothetical protein